MLELLRAAPSSVDAVLAIPSARAAQAVEQLARSMGIRVESSDTASLDRLTGGGHHQGVAARVRAFEYVPTEDVLAAGHPLLVALDGIMDPRNLGAIVRSAEVLGAGGILLPRDRSAPVTPAVVRAASGASLHLPIARVVNLVRALARAKELGYWVIGLDPLGPSGFQELPDLERAILVVGGEGKGTRPLVLGACDFRVRIPVRGRVTSLNASVAAAIGMYELVARLSKRDPEAIDS